MLMSNETHARVFACGSSEFSLENAGHDGHVCDTFCYSNAKSKIVAHDDSIFFSGGNS